MYPSALMRGNLPSNTQTQLLRNRLSLASSLTISVSRFSWAGRTKKQGKGRADPMSVLRSPTFHPQRHLAPPHLPRIHFQGNLHPALCHSASPRAAGGIFSLRFEISFIRALTLFFLCCCSSFDISSTGQGGQEGLQEDREEQEQDFK